MEYSKDIQKIINCGDVKINYMVYPGLDISIISSPECLITEICKEFNLDIQRLKSKYRGKKYVETRYLLYYLLYYENIIKFKRNIGKLFNRHHSSVIHGLTTFTAWLEVDQEIQKMYKNVIKKYNLGDLGPK
jgi:chromosomal replication initiation ATPase DnaA